ncbi:MAG: carbohydrate ABC transporter permease [Crenarchaeota archaeon]|nr:carbohydrate ABC transporter permease [Thermoproteota archaeon]
MAKPSKYLIYLALILVAFYSLGPIYYIFIVSISWPKDVVKIPSPLIPNDPTIANYMRIFGYSTVDPVGNPLRPAGQYRELIRGMINSAIIGVPVTIITTAIVVPAGYVLGRYRVKSKNALIAILFASRTIPPVSLLVPFYAFYVMTGLRGTYIGLILVHLTITIPLMTWILMGYFATLPTDLEKSARIDGCGRFSTFTKVAIPLAMPAIASTSILTFLYSWNEFLYGMLLSGGADVQPFTPFLTTFFQNITVETSMAAAAMMTNITPAILVAAVLQRYITSIKIIDPGTVVV